MTPNVLIADDEPDLRRILEFVLRRAGFVVWAAADGVEAVELFQAHPDIGIAVLDVMMPRLDGIGALRELRRLNPGLRCCLCSGITDSLTPDEEREFGDVVFIPKPIPIDQLVRALQTA